MAKPLVLTKVNVLATMRGDKTMTRRIIKPQPPEEWNEVKPIYNENGDIITFCFCDSNNVNDYGYKESKYQVGDEVYVAEGYQITGRVSKPFLVNGIYLADGAKFDVELTLREWHLWLNRKFPYRPTSGRFMYKSLARTFMRITEVKVELLHAITLADIRAEGISWVVKKGEPLDMVGAFERLWNSIHGDRAWDLNPWVFGYRWELIRSTRNV